MKQANRMRATMRGAVLGGAVLLLAGCSATFRDHGYIPPQEDLDLLAVGIDTRASVEDAVGSPSAGGLLEGGDYYYVKSRVKTLAFRAPEVVEREVLAISFDEAGVVQNIERFGLQDGRVVPLSRRVTDSSISNKSFLRRLLGNIGRATPSF